MVVNVETHLHVSSSFEDYALPIYNSMSEHGLDILYLSGHYVPIYDDVRRSFDDLRKHGFTVDSDSSAIKVTRDERSIYVMRSMEMGIL